MTLSTSGAVSTSSPPLTVTADASGSASFSVPITVATTGVGSVTAQLSYGDAADPLQNSATLWIAHDARGDVVAGGSQIEARIKALKADHPNAQDQAAAWSDLTALSPARQSIRRLTTAAATAAATAQTTLSGTVTYRDWNNVSHPARHLNVDLDRTGLFGSHLGSTTTDDNGHYSFTVSIGGATDVQVTFHAQSSAGRVGTSGLLGLTFTTYSEHTPTQTINPGESWVDTSDLGTGDAISNSFAVLDTVWSVHLFAGASGHGDESSVDVEYPTGSDQRADTDGDGIHLGAWEWSAWDVIDHEYGHWYDMKHHLSPLIGGTHCITDNLASGICGGAGGLRSGDDGRPDRR